MSEELSEIAAGLAPRYRVLGVLGEGACGVVYDAVRSGDGAPVAIKLLHRQYAGDESVRKRFEREARIMAGLKHPHVVRVDEAGELGGRPFLVMEKLPGKDLDQLLEEGAPAPERLREWMVQAAGALAAAHEQGVVHRDLKPANMLVDTEGRIKISDFGLASGALFEELTRTGSFVGTPIYMAPEQFHSMVPDPKMDVFSLGAILFKAFEGASPHGGRDLGELVRDKQTAPAEAPGSRRLGGPDLERLVLEMLDPDPDRRPASMEEVRRRLAGEAPRRGAEPTPAPVQATPPSGGHPRLSDSVARALEDLEQRPRWKAAVLLGLFLVFAGVGFLARRPAEPATRGEAPGAPPGPTVEVGLGKDRLYLRLDRDLERPLRLVVRTEVGVEKTRDLAPGTRELELPWNEFFPARCEVRLLDPEQDREVYRDGLSLAPVELPSIDQSQAYTAAPVPHGGALLFPRAAGRVERVRVSRRGVELLGPLEAARSWGDHRAWTRLADGSMVGLFQPGAGKAVQLVELAPGAAAEVRDLPFDALPPGWLVELPRRRVLYASYARTGREHTAFELALDTGRIRELELPEGQGADIVPLVSGEHVWMLLGSGPESRLAHLVDGETGLELIRDLHGIELLGKEGFRPTLGADGPRVAFATGGHIRLADARLLPPGSSRLAELGPEQGLWTPGKGKLMSRRRAIPSFEFVQGKLYALSVVESREGRPAFLPEDFALFRLDPDQPASPPVELWRRVHGSTNAGLGTWPGRTNMAWVPEQELFLITYETDRVGDRLAAVGIDGELLYYRVLDEEMRVGRSVFMRVEDGLVAGDFTRDVWYLPIWF